jgi:hypothetical protein
VESEGCDVFVVIAVLGVVVACATGFERLWMFVGFGCGGDGRKGDEGRTGR